MYGPLFDEIRSHEAQLLIQALAHFTDRLYDAAHSVPSNIENKIERTLLAPPTEAEALGKRRRKAGFHLYINAENGTYGVIDQRGGAPMSTAGLGEIERWLDEQKRTKA